MTRAFSARNCRLAEVLDSGRDDETGVHLVGATDFGTAWPDVIAPAGTPCPGGRGKMARIGEDGAPMRRHVVETDGERP